MMRTILVAVVGFTALLVAHPAFACTWQYLCGWVWNGSSWVYQCYWACR